MLLCSLKYYTEKLFQCFRVTTNLINKSFDRLNIRQVKVGLGPSIPPPPPRSGVSPIFIKQGPLFSGRVPLFWSSHFICFCNLFLTFFDGPAWWKFGIQMIPLIRCSIFVSPLFTFWLLSFVQPPLAFCSCLSLICCLFSRVRLSLSWRSLWHRSLKWFFEDLEQASFSRKWTWKIIKNLLFDQISSSAWVHS